MKLQLLTIAASLLFIVACEVEVEGDSKSSSSRSETTPPPSKPRAPESKPNKYAKKDIVGEWISDCYDYAGANIIKTIKFNENDQFEIVEAYYSPGVECHEDYYQYDSITEGNYSLKNVVNKNIYGIDITYEDSSDTFYYSLMINKKWLNLSNSFSHTPEVRVMTFEENQKAYRQ
ncbi:hypothetical protein N9N67_07860 [Bacteriovoracaceae bacterium]|nr:hypothetical protein [Bacteriovoracaceae bacterium]